MWRLDREDYYFRIYDRRKDVAGYFDPDYGRVPRGEEGDEEVESMWRNRDPVPGGHLTVGLARFGIFGGEYSSDIGGLEERLGGVARRAAAWREFLEAEGVGEHYVSVSHTDQDMLAIAFPVRFSPPEPLEARGVGARLAPTLDLLQKRGLL